MCQLAAYIGDRPIASLLLNSLEIQEPLYGGHATGMGVLNENHIDVVKTPGYVSHVKNITNIEKLTGTCAIAHSRYSDNARDNVDYNTAEMAHPFLSDDGKIALMHNGFIANYKPLWDELKDSHTFRSYSSIVNHITDSEVAVHMLSDAVAEGMTMTEAFQHVASRLKGTFLLGAIHVDEPETVYIANWYQPCYVAVGRNEVMFTSSRRGLREVWDEIDRVFQPPKNSVIKLTRNDVEINVLDKSRSIPQLSLNQFTAEKLLMEAIEKKGSIDVRRLFYELLPEGWGKVFGITPEEFKSHRRDGVYVLNPYFELLEALVADGRLVEFIDPRSEGGVDGTPRYSYRLA
ncbi:MAG: hypothetical protein NWE89_09160 [Candidatus Bathyarchaeota archaeon]|nr:hypothetical protein [Candidatus Bathyarchaeota archaeon]